MSLAVVVHRGQERFVVAAPKLEHCARGDAALHPLALEVRVDVSQWTCFGLLRYGGSERPRELELDGSTAQHNRRCLQLPVLRSEQLNDDRRAEERGVKRERRPAVRY